MAWFSRVAHPEDQLSAYVDGELDARARRAVEAHLAGCEACTALLAELQATKSMFAALPREEPRRSFTLGPQYAVKPRSAVQRTAWTLAPAAALTVLVALVVVDLADFSNTSNDAGSFSTAGTDSADKAAAESAQPARVPQAAAAPTDSPTQRQPAQVPQAAAAPTAPAGQNQPAVVPQAAGASADSAEQQQPTAAAAAANSTVLATPPGGQGAASSTAPSATPGAAEPRADAGEAADTTAPPEDETSGRVVGTDDSSGGPSLLRILEVVAAVALAGSLVAVYLSRLKGRREG